MKMSSQKPHLNLVVIGHVDHGKSTCVGHLLLLKGQISDRAIREHETEAKKFGTKKARILSVSPCSFDTEMGRLEEESGSAEILKFAALKRFGKPEEIAE